MLASKPEMVVPGHGEVSDVALIHAPEYPTPNARSNCVLNEEGPFTLTLPPGNYRIQANAYLGMFAYNYSTVPVVNLHVLPAPPPPPPVEDPCDPYGCWYY